MDKVALITGGGSGIGKEISIFLAKHRIKTCVIDSDPLKGSATTEQILKDGGESIFQLADVSNDEQIQNAIASCVEIYGQLDIGVNSAGIAGARTLTHQYGEDDWNKVISINLTGVWLAMKYQLSYMVPNQSGTIVNISSIAGLVGLPNASAYVAAKHAIIGLTKTAALEYAQSGISINAISPGWTRTDLIKHKIGNKEQEKILADRHPIGRLCEPEEIAETVVWLCTQAPRSITGTVIPVDGGFTAK